MCMIIYSQTHTLKDNQKHNQNNNRQKHIGDDVTKNYQIWAYLRFWEIGTNSTPQKYKPMLLVKFRNLNMEMYDYQKYVK